MNKHPEQKEIGIGWWAFAIVNNKLAEISFKVRNNKMSVCAHYYVKEEEYKARWEKKAIKDDTAKYKYTWKKGEYKQVQVIPAKKSQGLTWN